MAVLCLQEKRFDFDRSKVHQELVNYFVNLDEQRKLWNFTRTVRFHAGGHRFTSAQATRLVRVLAQHGAIRRVHTEVALAYNPFVQTKRRGVQHNIIPLRRGAMTVSAFDELLELFSWLVEKRLIEYRQALDLVLVLIGQYPETIQVLP